jgi:hypothetical protein
MPSSAEILFDLIDQRLDTAANHLRGRVFAASKNLAWTPDQRQQVLPLMRQELDDLILQILKLLDNVGCVLPDDVDGWRIIDAADGRDITVNELDYADLWREHRLKKTT